nr:hypothetical protein [Tanacetum cinerariifolium]
MEIDGVGWDLSYMANDEEDHALVAKAPTEFALMANTSTKNKVFDNSLCSKYYIQNNDSLNSKITDLTDKLFDAKIMIYHYKLELAQVESRRVEYKEREVKYIEKIRTLEFYDKGKMECIETLKKDLETLKQEKEVVDGKLAGLLSASKNLDNLIKSQRSDKSKEGLGYTVVPPPVAQLYLSPKKDLSWTGLPECADDTVTDYSRPSPTVESTKVDASKDVKKDVSSLRYIVLPNWVHEEHLESTSTQPQDTRNTDTSESSGNSNRTATSTNPPADQLKTLTVETPIPTFKDILGVTSNSKESNGVEADVSYMKTSITASPIPTLRIHRDHPKSQIISHVDTPIQTRNKSK